MKKAANLILSFFLLCFLIYIVDLNIGLYYQPEFKKYGKTEINQDILNQLRFLKQEIHNGKADEMQKFYPEGFLFLNAQYGLSWCEVANVVDHQSDLYKEAHDEIQFSWSAINSDKGKSIFSKYLAIPYGVFYTGWNNYLLGKKLSVENPDERDSLEIKQFNLQCNEIAAVLGPDKTPFPESYENASWPSDGVVAVASLSMHDKIFDPEFKSVINEWIRNVKMRTDTNGLIPHSVHSFSGFRSANARGSSQSLILNFLIEIDSTFARRQFEIYKDKFLTTRFGLPGIREYPEGESGSGDVDSGPVIFDIGGAASIVGLRTMTLFGENKTALGLRNSIEAFGMTSTSDGKKKFLFGKIPMADAFIVWANSKEITKDKMLSSDEHWRLRFQLYSLLTGFLLILFLLWLWEKLPRLLKR